MGMLRSKMKRDGKIFKFRIFIAGDGLNSTQALFNLNAICNAYLPDRFSIEVVDVFREPKRALAEKVFMTPTLIKLVPVPIMRIVGTLTHTELVLQALGLEAPVS